MHRDPLRWSKLCQIVKMLQFGFQALVDQQKRLQRSVNIAAAFFNQLIDYVAD